MSSVKVLVMRVRKMRVCVCDGVVPVSMAMARTSRHRFVMLVHVVFVAHTVSMRVRVFERLVCMFMHMPLGQVQRHAHGHQRAAQQQCHGNRLVKQCQSHQRTEERCHGEISASAGSAEMPQSDHEQRETGSIAKKADQGRAEHRYCAWPCRAQAHRHDEIRCARRQPLDHRDP